MTQAWLWAGFAVLVIGILAFDLGVAGRGKHEISTRRALTMVGAYAAFALGFVGAVLVTLGADPAMEYVTAWLSEQRLSLDNLFDRVMIIQNFKIEVAAQQRVPFWGILGPLCMRALFIFP